MSDGNPLRVFISYSHDSREHAARVAALSDRLRGDGVDCRIDQYYVRLPEGWVEWMNRQVEEADTILLVCTEIYRQRFDRTQPPTTGRGVRWESHLMKCRLYRAGTINDKLLPVLFDRDDEQHIPDELYDFDRAHVDPDNLDGDGYDELLRQIHRIPAHPMPPLGSFRSGGPQAPPLETLKVEREFFLPATGEFLVGRSKQLAQLTRAWNNEKVNVISLVAFGGVGKSALVNRWLAAMGSKDYCGARRVYGWSAYSQGSKERVTSANLFIDRALAFFGEQGELGPSIEARAIRLAELVREEPTLLILDGIEPLQYPPGPGEGQIKDPGLRTLVRELAAQNPGLCVITTRVAVSDLAHLESTTCPRINLEPLHGTDGAKLLEKLGVKGTQPEREAASEEFGGHALALTLLGTYLRDACAGDIWRRDQIGPLVDELQNGGHARRVMDSYETWLGPGPEMQILRMLGLFDRPAESGAVKALRSEPGIEGLTDRIVGLDERAWQNALIRLRHAGLLAESDAAAPREIDAHPLVREHFGEKLRREDEAAWRGGHDRLFEYCRGDGCPKELPDTSEEMAPLYAAIGHGCNAGRYREAFEEVYRLRIRRGNEAYNLKHLGAFGSDLAALSGFFDPPWCTLVATLSDPYRAFLLSEAGFELRALGRLAEAIEPMEAGLDAYVAQKKWKNAGKSAGNLSGLRLTLGRIDEAIALAERSVEYADKRGDAFERMSKRATLADALCQAGRLDQSEERFQEAETMQKDGQPEHPLLYSLRGYHYCDLLLERGRHEEVHDRAAQTLRWGMQVASLLDVGLNHLSLARAAVLAVESGRGEALDRGRSHAQAAVDRLRQASQQDHLPDGLLTRAEVHRLTGDLDAARGDLGEAMAIATRDPAGHMKLHETDCHLALARVELAAGYRDRAAKHLSAAEALIQETGYHRRDGELARLKQL
ncbi:MAG: TIR domain-containing protein [Planctomycetes bacterium]|nr:TIR domain-containing protein [Planctomycetota bacterium]